MNVGIVYAALAFAIWGVFPLYFARVASVSPLEVVLHRSAWSLVCVLALLAVLRRWGWVATTPSDPRRIAIFAASAILLAVNWLVYVIAVQTGHVVDSSLGYFINPLFNVVLGVAVLRERLRPPQKFAVALATIGVAWLTWQAGHLPWIALVLAGSFGLYGLLRKTAPLGAIEGLALENLILAPLVLPALAWWTCCHGGGLARGDAALTLWLLFAGPLTTLPLLLFAAGARRIPLATLGMLQYIGPTLQLMLGVWVFREPFDRDRMMAFGLIWAALAIVSADAAGLKAPIPGLSRPR
jgi:chloramphenicol-sensitive protein RarD